MSVHQPAVLLVTDLIHQLHQSFHLTSLLRLPVVMCLAPSVPHSKYCHETLMCMLLSIALSYLADMFRQEDLLKLLAYAAQAISLTVTVQNGFAVPASAWAHIFCPMEHGCRADRFGWGTCRTLGSEERKTQCSCGSWLLNAELERE